MRALVLSGGGTRGIYQVGALKYLLKEKGLKYDLIIGTSIGSVNGGVIAQGEEHFDTLLDVWNSIEAGDVFSLKFPWGLNGIFGDSLFKGDLIQGLIAKYIDPRKIRAQGKIYVTNAVDRNSCKHRIFRSDDGSDIRKAIAASCAIPGIFPTVNMGGREYFDGGIMFNFLINYAFQMGVTEIDAISCCNWKFIDDVPGLSAYSPFFPRNVRTIFNAAQALYNGSMYQSDIRGELMSEINGVKLNIIRPSEKLHGALSFDRIDWKKAEELGYVDCKKYFDPDFKE